MGSRSLGTIVNYFSPFIIAGPCVIEGRDFLLRHGEALRKIHNEVDIPIIFKASADKANRSSHTSFRGIGWERGLATLAEVKNNFNLLLCTDVHEVSQIRAVAEVVDIIQIPALLSRQTDLLINAGLTGKVIQVKKGQFLAPHDMVHVAAKIRSTGNKQILLTERGTSFGYRNLIVDMRSFAIMKETGYPVVFDATHSVQLPTANGNVSGGEKRFIPVLAQAAIAAGANGIFMECHLDPDNAKSDATTQYPMSELESLLYQLKRIWEVCD